MQLATYPVPNSPAHFRFDHVLSTAEKYSDLITLPIVGTVLHTKGKIHYLTGAVLYLLF